MPLLESIPTGRTWPQNPISFMAHTSPLDSQQQQQQAKTKAVKS